MEKIKHPDQDTLVSFFDTIDGIMGIEVNHEDGHSISAKLGQLNSVLSASSTAVALAEKIYTHRMSKILKDLDLRMSATDKKMIITANCGDEQYWVTQTERQNAAIVHAIDGYRSMLSFLKDEMKMNSQYNPQNQ